MARLIVLALCVLGLAGCLASKACPSMGFERLTQASRVDITTNNDVMLRAVRGSKAVAPFVAFALAHKSGWAAPAVGTPVALVNINFYAGNTLLGTLGIGSNFLTAPGCGGFQSRDVSGKDRQAIMELLAVRDPYKK